MTATSTMALKVPVSTEIMLPTGTSIVIPTEPERCVNIRSVVRVVRVRLVVVSAVVGIVSRIMDDTAGKGSQSDQQQGKNNYFS
jgi:hypothetical protein